MDACYAKTLCNCHPQIARTESATFDTSHYIILARSIDIDIVTHREPWPGAQHHHTPCCARTGYTEAAYAQRTC
jgi:hypothetical protein